MAENCEMRESRPSSGLKFNHEQNLNAGATDALERELCEKLPQFVNAQGGFDLGKLKEALHPNLQGELEHGCCLDFIGKTYARKQASAQADTLIVPDVEHNEKPENARSENLFFTGDNLDVLRHLKNNYYNSVDLIYIDPPYNTGSDDFVYPDKFEWSEEDLKEEFGMSDVQIKRLKTLQGRSSHSAWLAFMYPRLFIACQLLKDSGVIFVSIDDNEQAHLKLLLDEVFGEGNFVGELIHQRAKGGGQAKNIVKGHDYILVFSKNIDNVNLSRKKVVQGPVHKIDGEDYLISDDVVRKTFGKYDRNLNDRRCFYEELLEYKGEAKKNEIDELLKKGELFLQENQYGMHTICKKEKVDDARSKMYSIIKALSEEGTARLNELDINCFSNPKPVKLLSQLLDSVLHDNKNALILDFFAGSGTTADAVMQLNAEDGGKRKFILVQLPEVCKDGSVAKKNGYETIDEITRERVKRSASKILEEKQGEIFFKADEFDGGFKHFRVMNLPDNYIGNIKSINDAPQMFSTITQCEGGAASILATWMAMDGFKFDVHVKVEEFAGCVANVIEDVLYILEMWSSEATEELINRLGTYDEKLVLRKIVVAEDVLTFEKHLEIKNELKRLKSGSGIEVALEVRN